MPGMHEQHEDNVVSVVKKIYTKYSDQIIPVG